MGLRTRRVSALALGMAAVVAAAVFAGCGGGDGGGGANVATTHGLSRVKVAVLPAADAVPLYLGVKQGFFKKEGLDVRTTVVPSGSAMVPAVLNGEQQYGFSNVLSTITAASKGLPVQIVTPGVTANPDTASSGNALLVSKKSGISSDPKSLEGKTIAVTSIGDLGMTATKQWMQNAGADPAKVKFVEFGFPEMVPAIQRGNVDGAVLVEPFQTIGLKAGLVKAADPSGAVLDGAPLAIYFGNRDYIKSHPEQVAAFQRAMGESLDYAQAHPHQARDEIVHVLKVDPAVAKKMRLPLWKSGLTQQQVQKAIDLAKDQGLISKPVDAASLLATSDGN